MNRFPHTLACGLILGALVAAAGGRASAYAGSAPAAATASSIGTGSAVPTGEDGVTARAVESFLKAYLGGNPRWELFRDDELRTSGSRELSGAIRNWERGRGGGAQQAIAAIRAASPSARSTSLGERTAAYADILEILDQSASTGSAQDVHALLEAASFTERLSSRAIESMDDRRPRLIEREADRALRRVRAPALIDALDAILSDATPSKGDLGAHRKGIQTLGQLAGQKGRSKKALERIADRLLRVFIDARDDDLRLASVAALRNLSDSHDSFPLGDARRTELLDWLQDQITRAPETTALVVLRLLGTHPHLDTVERIAHLQLKVASRLPERLQDELWTTLETITPASIPRSQGPEAWLAWFEREKDEPRLAHWLQTHARGVRPVVDSTYAKARFYGVPIVGKTVIFVIDVSGSMSQPLGGTRGDVKIDGAKKELVKALEAMAETSQFNIVHFATEVESWQRRPVSARTHRKPGIAMVQGLEALGGTNLHGGLMAGFGLVDLDRRAAVTGLELPDQIILLSDGNPSAGLLTNSTDILNDLDRVDPARLTRIDTIAFGRGADRGFLGQLAKRFGGAMADIK